MAAQVAEQPKKGKPSRAQQNQDIHAFVQEVLKGEDLERDELVRRCRKAGYSSGEVMGEFKVNATQMAKMEGKQIKEVRKNDSKLPDEDFEPSEKGSALKEILETTAGIASERANKIVKRYQTRQDVYDANPMKLYRTLINGGISWIRAQNVTQEFIEETNPDVEGLLPWNEGRALGNAHQVDPWASFSGSGLPTGPRELYGRSGGVGYDDEEAEERREQRRMDRQMNRALMALMMSNMGQRNQGSSGFPGMGTNPFMATEFEPILDSEGKVMKDEVGNPIMRYKMSPVQLGNGAKEKPDYEPIKILADALTSASTSKSDLVEKFADLVKDANEKQVSMLTDRLSALEQQDPFEAVDSIMGKMHDWGFGTENESLEAVKVNTDLKKWMHEQDHSLQKWIWEQKDKAKDKEYAKAQMREFNETLRQGMSKIGQPLVEAFKQGYVSEKGKNGNGNGQRQRQEGPGRKPLKEMGDEEVLDLYGQSKQSERIVQEAQSEIVAELRRRGKTPPNEITA